MSGRDRLLSRLHTTAVAAGRNSTHRFLAYATLLTAAVATLAGYAADAVLFTPLFYGHDHASLSSSDLATLLTTQVVQGLFWTVVALYLSIPVAVTTYLTDRGDRHWLYALVWSAAAIVALPLAASVAALLSPTPFRPVFAVGVVTVVVVPVAAGHWLAVRIAPDDAATTPPPATFFNVVVAGLFLTSYVLAPTALAGLNADLVEDDSLTPPIAAWDFEYEPTSDGSGLLTVTHDGGDKVEADTLYIRGSGFADVAGVDRTEPGPWTGETTSGTLEAGDSTTVGVTNDCEIRLVYEEGDSVQTIGYHECGRAGEGALGGQPRDGGGP